MQNAIASFSSLFGKEPDCTVIAITLSPNISCATFNKNVESKRDIISELKNIKVNSTNKHKEIELDSYIVSIVMIIITSNASVLNENEYVIYMLIQDKKTDDLYGKFNLKTFFDEEDANTYYDKMILEASTFSKEKIEDLVRDL